ncbi:hypothetical protein [Actinopolyspora xinjiangensis]|uniref:hypothetical protein n=1 Tax=Actinopolyspora xinjiangensis TaxID=405564 RepID=UPI0011146711|nr:hypothetical protein [Actinopolyspora xinjiangensis]
MGKSMDKMGRRAQIALGGIEAGSAAAATAVAGSVAALPVAFTAMGAAAVSSNEEVQDSFRSLSSTIQDGVAADAEPMADALVGAADQIGAAYQSLRPQLRDAFEASAPHVETLTDGVVDFATNAMPGMVTSIERAQPVMDGLATAASDAGTGIGEFFEVVSTGSVEAGQGIEHIGSLVRGTLPELGGILTDLTGLWAEHGDQVAETVTRMTSVVGDLSGDALPVLSSSLGVTLDVLDGVLAVVEPLSGVLGPMVGTWLSLAAAMRTVRGVRGIFSGVASQIANVQDRVTDLSGRRGFGRLSIVSRGVMGLLGGPWGLAIAGATAALAAFGASSQESAQDQRDLAGALRESGGEFDEAAQRALVQSEQYQAVKDSIDDTTVSQRDYVSALTNGGPALEQVTQALDRQIEAGKSVTQNNFRREVSYNASARAALRAKDALDPLRNTVQGASKDFQQEAEAVQSTGEQMIGAVPGAERLDQAMQTLKNSTAATADRADALTTAWRQLFGVELSLEEATGEYHEQLRQLRTSLDSAGVGAGNWRNELLTASGAIDRTTAQGWDLWQNLEEQGKAYQRLGQTAYDTARRQNKTQEEAAAIAREKMSQQRAQFRQTMRSAGFTADEVQRLTNKFFGIPSEVLTGIRTPGSWEAISQANSVRDAVNSIPDYHSTTLTVEPIMTDLGAYYPGRGTATRAHGGVVTSRRPTLVGENGPELLYTSAPAQVIPNRHTEDMRNSSQQPRGARERATVHIEAMYATPEQSPGEIARELDWQMRGGG